jgi:hypothetical protein
MFTRSDLTTLMEAAPPLGVSIFLPTHVLGRETRQDPIRLKNLAAEAREKLGTAGVQPAEAEALLAPAAALVDDYGFWQHQDQGLALFLWDGGMRRHKVPITLAERVVVGPGFHVKPLLPVLAQDGAFLVLTITADTVRLFDASRFSMVEDDEADLPRGLDEVTGGPDYENPVQAAPVARPHTGSINIGNAQVYGDSPEDWRKARTVEFVRRTAAALESHLASERIPVVVAADAEIGGHFQKLTTLGPLLAGVIEINPEALDGRDLHASAYAVVRPRFDGDRRGAVERFAALSGSGDARAATRVEDVVKAAHHGRIDTLLLAEGAHLRGRFDEAADKVTIADGPAETGEDLLDTAAVRTLRHSGSVYLLPRDEMPDAGTAAAILRY